MQTVRDVLSAFDKVRVLLSVFRLLIEPFALSILYVPAVVVNNVVINLVVLATIYIWLVVFATQRERVVQLINVEVGARLESAFGMTRHTDRSSVHYVFIEVVQL